MGRLEEMYDEPLKFAPERWFQPRNLKKTPFEYPVFQAGPRTCLGQHMVSLPTYSTPLFTNRFADAVFCVFHVVCITRRSSSPSF